MTSSRALTTALLATILTAGVASAEPSPKERAAKLDAEALVLATEKQDMRGALDHYEQALLLETTPQRICNVGMAHYQLDALPAAYLFLGQCLSHAGRLPAARVATLSDAYAYVDRKLQAGAFTKVTFTANTSQVRVVIPKLGRGAAFVLPRTLWLPFGEQSYEASADGYETHQGSVTVAKAEEKAQSVVIDLAKIAVPSLPTKDHTSEPTTPLATTPATTAPRHEKSSKLPAWITLSSGAALVIAGGVFHLRAAGVRSDLEGLPSGESRRALIEDLKRERLIMGGLYGAGALVLGVGTFLMLSDDDSEGQETPKLGLQLGAANIGIYGSF